MLGCVSLTWNFSFNVGGGYTFTCYTPGWAGGLTIDAFCWDDWYFYEGNLVGSYYIWYWLKYIELVFEKLTALLVVMINW